MSSTDPSHCVRPITRADLRAASQVLADAFFEDPLFAFMVPQQAARRRWLRALMRGGLGMALPDGHVYGLIDRSGAVAGVISALAPGRYPPPRRRAFGLYARLLGQALIGRPTPPRAAAGIGVLSEMGERHVKEPHWYVVQVGVAPRHHGRGMGRRLMNTVLDRADATETPTFLETSNQINLGFYGRLGFEVCGEIHGRREAPPVWLMRRPPERPWSRGADES